MTSIQQSMNQMITSLAGMATAGAYMARSGPKYQNEQRARRIEEAAETEAEIAAVKDLTEEEVNAGKKVIEKREQVKGNKKMGAIDLLPEEYIEGGQFANQIAVSRAESLKKSAQEAYLASPNRDRQEAYYQSMENLHKAQAEAKQFQRTVERYQTRISQEQGLEERKAQIEWQQNLKESLSPYSQGAYFPSELTDNVKLAKITSRVKYKARQEESK